MRDPGSRKSSWGEMRRNPQADEGLGRGDGGGAWGRESQSASSREHASSLEMPESSRRDFSHDDEMDKRLAVSQSTKKALDNWQRS